MGKKKSDGEKLFFGLLAGAGVIGLYYLTAGAGRENNAALIPDSIENRIDRLVATLNTQVGKDWGNRGVEALKVSLRRTLPPHLVTLVDVVYAVEQEARWLHTASNAKRLRAVTMANARGLA
jgi:hypothetical protein